MNSISKVTTHVNFWAKFWFLLRTLKELQQGVFSSLLLQPVEGHLHTKSCRTVTLWEQLQKFPVVPGDTVHNTPMSSSGALSEAAKPQGTYPLCLFDYQCQQTWNRTEKSTGFSSSCDDVHCSKLTQWQVTAPPVLFNVLALLFLLMFSFWKFH